MDLKQTQSNLTERETGSESEAVIDPVSVEEEVAGPSLASSTSILPAASASQETAASVEDAAPPPSAAPDPGSQEEHGHSSSPTVPLVSSPQSAKALRRGRRRRELQASRRDVDVGVLNYLARAATDEGEEAFARSLARYLRPLPREVRLRVRRCIQILIDLSSPPNNPYEVFELLERRQLSQTNLLRLQITQQVHGQSGFEAPPPRLPTPQLLRTQNQQRPAPYEMAACNPTSQYGHFSRPSDVGWSQAGFGQHGHFGSGYESSQYVRQHEGQRQLPYGQYPTGQYEQGLYLTQQLTASSQGEGQLAQQRPPEQDPELPPSPPPTYRDL
ncbi:epithelial-stromal interaction protein 1 isoform X1 [Ranitomeya imitator]|uniref:epithelial-stromal interaction protein 1 isoform X1 n=1 Tax=Ranitomeya imitator TaxID=111125 RepID=UPI0037E70D58